MKLTYRILLLISGILMMPAAQAHHPMGGAVPSTAWDGFLSGLAHPLIAIDHLLFLLAVATLLGLSRAPIHRSALALLVFILVSLIGATLRVSDVTPPRLELWIGASLLVVAFCLWQRRLLSVIPTLLTLATAGLMHGLAYGEAVIGAETTPVVWYLAGLLVVQGMPLLAGLFFVRRIAAQHPQRLQTMTKLLSSAAGAAGMWLMGSQLLA
jgi:urease accessory protein